MKKIQDFRHLGVPTPQDYLENLVVQPWMNNGVKPIPSVEAQKEARELLNRLREREKTEENLEFSEN